MKRLAIVIVLAGLALPAHAIVCAPGRPICQASPSTGQCQLDASRACLVNADCAPAAGSCLIGTLAIGGKVTPNGAAIVDIALSGDTNLTLVEGSPGSPTWFRVFPTTPGFDANGVVVATDAAAQTCRVPVTFKVRTAGPILPGTPEVPGNPEMVCPFAENYSLTVTSAPSSPAGTTACSSHLATCLDTYPLRPNGYDFYNDARIFGIRSPIVGPAVQMEMVRGGQFLADLRFLFSYSADGGATFGNFTNNTTSVDPGSTVIRGTGDERTNVKVAAGLPPLTVPTLGEWGMVILGLLLLASSTVLFANRHAATAGGGSFGAAILDRRLLLKVELCAVVLWLLAMSALVILRGLPGTTDMIGSLIAGAILAYLIHSWILQSRR